MFKYRYPKQPRKFDAVLGGNKLPPANGAVLGGLEGVNSRLQSGVSKAQLAALQEALNYGDAGLEIVIQALKYPSIQVRLSAYNILRTRSEAFVEEALANFNPYEFWQCVQTIKTSDIYVHSVAISPDNQTLVWGSGGDYGTKPTPGVWDIETGKQKFQLGFNHTNKINCVAISPDGQKMISVGGDRNIIIVDLTTGKLLQKRTSKDSNISSHNAVIDPYRETFYSADSSGYIRIWNWKSTQEIASFKGHDRKIYALCISADGNLLIGGAEDGIIKVWDLNSQEEIWSIKKHSQLISSLAISPDGRILVSGSDQRIKIWDIENRREIFSFYGHAAWVRSIVFSPNGQTFLTAGDEKIKVWDVASGKKLFSFTGHTAAILSLALSSNGEILVSGGADGYVKIWRF